MPKKSSRVVVMAAVTGAGAADPTITVIAKVPARDNEAALATRSGVGVFTITLKDKYKNMYPAAVQIMGSTADGKIAQISAVSAAGVVSLSVRNAAGAAADIATTDDLYLTIAAIEE
jgi:hypothetical protein